jgi:hypothetical protein
MDHHPFKNSVEVIAQFEGAVNDRADRIDYVAGFDL